VGGIGPHPVAENGDKDGAPRRKLYKDKCGDSSLRSE
jgi:hypothetical protein